jgi:pyridoxamine 5'-phosphate oxidase
MIEDIRKSYELGELTEAEAGDDPFALLRRWLDDALQANLVFYTNGNSAKGRQLTHRPYATLVFWWGALERQVRLRGRIAQVSEAEADAYFARRPRGHQLAAWVSPQSEPIPSRAWLEQRAAEVEREFEGREVPRPPYWTGYRLVPDAIEFWQGRRNRLHDRILFTRQPDGSWARARLAP